MNLFSLVLSFIQIFAHVQDERLYGPIKECLDQYKREITVLEIASDKAHYAQEIATTYDSAMVVLYLGKLMNKCSNRDAKNLIVLNPRTMTPEMLEILGKCEHFDVVIVHDIPQRLKKDQALDALFKLGDHLFIELSRKEKKLIESVEQRGGSLVATGDVGVYYSATPKKCLHSARWSKSHDNSKSRPRYWINSTYEQKSYSKPFLSNKSEIPWLKGINLVTFVALRGLCPSNRSIAQQFENFRAIAHNDLVLSNVIVQGDRITMIDTNDPRRNAILNQPKFINAALSLFLSDFRLENPEGALTRYHEVKISSRELPPCVMKEFLRHEREQNFLELFEQIQKHRSCTNVCYALT